MIVTEESFKNRQHEPKYVLNFWGSIRNSDAKMPLGTKGSHYWCDTSEEIESIKSEISEIAKKTPSYHGASSCVLFSVYPCPGEDWSGHTDKSTVAVVSLDYLGSRYIIEYDFGYGCPESSARFMFEDGNYSCDCNLGSFIQGVCKDFPPMDCGHEIKIANIEIEYRQKERQEMSKLSLDAYYYGFYRTGVPVVDRILASVAAAGTAFHGTDQWTDVAQHSAFEGNTPQEWIQNAANEAANEFNSIDQSN